MSSTLRNLRAFLMFLGALVHAVVCAGQVTAAEASKARAPNIVFCFADDWGRYANCYAAIENRPSINQVLKTPNIDRVAREGVLFRNAFVTAPSCTPCRSSLLSGQYFFRTGRGAILQGAQWDASIPTYPLLLRDAGYHIGKSHKVWSPGTPVDAPYGGQQHAYEKAGRDFNNFSENATRLVREGLSFQAARNKLLAEVRGNFEAFLADRKPGQPFCYWFGPTLTHRAYEKGSGKALWGIEPDSLKGKLPEFMPDVAEVRADVADYMGEIQAWDAGIGVIRDRLEAIGELDNTLLVISGDHGMPGVPGGKCNLYDHGVAVALVARGPGIPSGRVADDFVNLMDLAPTFLETGGVRPPRVMTGRSFVNVLRSEQTGQVDPSRTWVLTGRERHVAGAREGNLPYPHRAIRTRDFLYVRNFAPDRWPMGSPRFSGRGDVPSAAVLGQDTRVAFADMDASPTKAWLVARHDDPQWKWHYDYAFAKRPAEELFDLRKDPDQAHNVAGDAAYAEAKKDLSQRLMAVLRETGDPRLTDAFDRPPYVAEDDRAPRAKKAAKGKPGKPNVLLICVDDLKPLLHCYGAPIIQSPSIDRLAARGVMFERAFCNQAVCAPSRNSLMTSLRPQTIGVYDLGTNFRKAVPDALTVAQHFQRHGYRTEALGKILHVGHGNHEDPASWSVPHWGPKAGPAGGYVLKENRPAQLTREEALFMNARPADLSKLPRGAATESADVPDSTYPDGKIADEAIRRLRAAKDKPDAPLLLAVGFLKPHLPFVAPKKYWDLYDPAALPMPALKHPPQGAPKFAPTTWGELRQYSDIPDSGPLDDAKARHLIHGYHAAVSYMDAQLGRVIDELDRLGMTENTLIVLWGDHGWHLGDHGMWCKHTNYEQAARIPLIVCAPGKAQTGVKTAALAETVDIYPTLCELAGLPVPPGLDGASLAAALTAPAAATKEAVFHVFPRGERIGRAVRTARHRLVEWKTPGAAADTAVLELYDYEADPGETKNLAAEQPAVVAQLRALLARQPEARPQIRAGQKPGVKPAAKPRQDRAAMFAKRDTNGDGKLDRREFLANQPDPKEAPKRFVAFDADKDGYLSKEEFVTAGGKAKP